MFTCISRLALLGLSIVVTPHQGCLSLSLTASHDALSLRFHEESSFTVRAAVLEGGGGDLVREQPATLLRQVAVGGGEEQQAVPGTGLHLK